MNRDVGRYFGKRLVEVLKVQALNLLFKTANKPKHYNEQDQNNTDSSS